MFIDLSSCRQHQFRAFILHNKWKLHRKTLIRSLKKQTKPLLGALKKNNLILEVLILVF